MPSESTWDARFLDMASLVGSWSKDPSTKQGAVIVRHDRTIAAMGFNGFPRRTSDDPALYENREEKYGRVVHAELNAILHKQEDLTGYTLYCAPLPPCDRCMGAIIQAGIAIVVSPDAEIADRWKPAMDRSAQMAQEAGVVIEYVPSGVWRPSLVLAMWDRG